MRSLSIRITLVTFLFVCFFSGQLQAQEKNDARFIAKDNGTVLDTKTGLTWAAIDNGADINWQSAKSYCKNYRAGGFTDWRMPTHDELAELYDVTKTYKSDCGYNVHLTELIHLTCTWVWASETRGSGASYLNFNLCHQWNWRFGAYDAFFRALPVRSGK
ncbi:MAG TPA: DUF1566 domain-containing protein [Syntrophales bacterium]|nr:DUF1566 domain-containing protein [Syntrophales bacterium]